MYVLSRALKAVASMRYFKQQMCFYACVYLPSYNAWASNEGAIEEGGFFTTYSRRCTYMDIR